MPGYRAPRTGETDEIRSASVGLRIQPSLKTALEVLAESEQRTLNYYIERILWAHVNAREWSADNYVSPERAAKAGRFRCTGGAAQR